MHAGILGAALVAVLASTAAHSAVVHREADQGEFSSNGLAPTPVAIEAGSNQIFGRMGGDGGGGDLDYFVVTVPTGMQLSAITLLSETRVIGVSFIGLQAGTELSVSPFAGSANGLLGWYHYGASDLGTDILPQIAGGFGASGFTPPLAAGSYAFWLQETGPGSVTYGLDLVVQPVPLPGALAAFALSMTLLGSRLGHRRDPAAGPEQPRRSSLASPP